MAIEDAIATKDMYSKYEEKNPWVAPEAKANTQAGSQQHAPKPKVEKEENSGQDFINYAKNRFNLKAIKTTLQATSLNQMLIDWRDNMSPILAYVNSSGHANEEHIIKNLLNNDEVSSLIVISSLTRTLASSQLD